MTDPAHRFVLAVAVVVLGCHLLGALARRLGQPAVLGEIAGGLVWGPAALGLVWPAGQAWLFPPGVVVATHAVAELGVVCFGFLLGSELRFRHLSGRPGTVTLVVAGSTGVPFLAGAGIAWAGHNVLRGAAAGPVTQICFIGLAMSVTALPVLARILSDVRLAGTPLGTLALACAAIGDAIIWIALAFVVSVGGAGGAVTTLALAAALVVLIAGLLRPALRRLAEHCQRRPAASAYLPASLVAGALLSAAVTQLIGLPPVIGAFLFGLAIPRDTALAGQVHRLVSGFTLAVLLPLFFASVGFRLGAGGPAGGWLLFAPIMLVAVVAKLLGASAGARLAGVPARSAVRLGVLMNCRGVTELVVLAIGYEQGLISAAGYSLLVLMALVTTAMTGPLLWLTGVRQRAATRPRRAPPR